MERMLLRGNSKKKKTGEGSRKDTRSAHERTELIFGWVIDRGMSKNCYRKVGNGEA